jgi:hypothetical protein
MDLPEFELRRGEIYAILPDNSTVHVAGKYLGTVDISPVSGGPWFAFNMASEEDPRIRFFNPAHIRSLLPETKPE